MAMRSSKLKPKRTSPRWTWGGASGVRGAQPDRAVILERAVRTDVEMGRSRVMCSLGGIAWSIAYRSAHNLAYGCQDAGNAQNAAFRGCTVGSQAMHRADC